MRQALLILVVLLAPGLAGCSEDPESRRDPPPAVRALGCPAFETQGRGEAPGIWEAAASVATNQTVTRRIVEAAGGLPAEVSGAPNGTQNSTITWIHHGPLGGIRRGTSSVEAGWIRLSAGGQEPRLEGEFPGDTRIAAIAPWVAAWLVERFGVEQQEADSVALEFVEGRVEARQGKQAGRDGSRDLVFRANWGPEPFSIQFNGTQEIVSPEPRSRQVRLGNDTIHFSLDGVMIEWSQLGHVASLLLDQGDLAAVSVEGLRPVSPADAPELLAQLLGSDWPGHDAVEAWSWSTQEVTLDRTHALCRVSA